MSLCISWTREKMEEGKEGENLEREEDSGEDIRVKF